MPLFINLTMSIEKKRGSYRNLREKLWIINFSEKNKDLTHDRVAFATSTEFRRPISRSNVSRILRNKSAILSMADADPDIKLDEAKQVLSVSRTQFESDLQEILEKKYRSASSLKYYMYL